MSTTLNKHAKIEYWEYDPIYKEYFIDLIPGFAVYADTHDRLHGFGAYTVKEILNYIRENVSACSCAECIELMKKD